MVLQRKFAILGIIGCLCFGIGDWLLGYVDPTAVEEDFFYFIKAGHGADYNTSKISVTLIFAMLGMCFLYPGFTHISDIAKSKKTKNILKYTFGLCSIGWLVIHFIVATSVFVSSQADKYAGREFAAVLSKNFTEICIAALFCAYLFAAAALVILPVAILRSKTLLKKSAALLTPIVPMAIIALISQLLPSSAFSYGLYTFCMNCGMIVWFVYLLLNNRKSTVVKEDFNG